MPLPIKPNLKSNKMKTTEIDTAELGEKIVKVLKQYLIQKSLSTSTN